MAKQLSLPERIVIEHMNEKKFFEYLKKEKCTSRGAQLASIRQMSGQVSRSSAGEYQADERAGVAQLSWRVSG